MWCWRFPKAVLELRVTIGGEHSGAGSKFVYISILAQITFRKASLVPGMVRWHYLKVLNVLVCLND